MEFALCSGEVNGTVARTEKRRKLRLGPTTYDSTATAKTAVRVDIYSKVPTSKCYRRGTTWMGNALTLLTLLHDQ